MSATLHFVKQHWEKAIIALSLVLTLFLFFGRLTSNSQGHKKDFVAAREIAAQLNAGEYLDPSTEHQLEAILKRHPELHPTYAPLLISQLQHTERSKELLKHAHKLVHRAASPYKNDIYQFATTSLLIYEERYKEALASSEQLKGALTSEQPLLQACNLLRIITLAAEVGDKERSKSAWEELQKLPSFNQLQHICRVGDYSLHNFITGMQNDQRHSSR